MNTFESKSQRKFWAIQSTVDIVDVETLHWIALATDMATWPQTQELFSTQTADRQTTANRIKQAGLAAGRVFFVVKRLTRSKYDSICSSLDCSLLRSARLFYDFYAFISTKSGKLGTSVCINRMPSYLFTS